MTDTLEKIIEQAALTAELQAGTDPAVLATRSDPGMVAALAGHHDPDKKTITPWTAEEDAFVRAALGDLSLEEIGARLGRSPNSVKVRYTRKGWQAPSKQAGWITANGVADALGVDLHSVTLWQQRGYMQFVSIPDLRMIRRIRRVDLLKWVIDPMHWPYFLYTLHKEIRHIPDAQLRKAVQWKMERWDDEWWHIGRVAEHYGVDHKDVNRVLVKNRKFADIVHTRTRFPNWWFLRSEVTHRRITFYKRGKGSNDVLFWPDEKEDFLVLAKAVGVPSVALTGMLGLRSGYMSNVRLATITRRGDLQTLIDRAAIPIQHDPERDLLFADWYPVRHRFPFLQRAARRLLTGRQLSHDQRVAIRSVFFTWAMWFATTSNQKQFAEKLRFSSMSTSTLHDRYREILTWGIDPLHAAELQL